MNVASARRPSPADRLGQVALFRHFPELLGRLPWFALGAWPTAVEPLACPERVANGSSIFVKREDLSHPDYGGNKIRTLEAHFGQVLASGCNRIWGTGAYGSNHTLATVTHAPRAGLRAGVALFWQPRTVPALANLSATLANEPDIVDVMNPLTLPDTLSTLRGQRRDGAADYLMPPGGATAAGSMGHVSAALELGEQIAAGKCPLPRSIVLALGSGCTTSGLLAGLSLAAHLGLGMSPTTVPRIVAVAVTPWPITARRRVLELAREAADRVTELVGVAIDREQLDRMLHIEHGQLGWGYGVPTAAGRRAIELMKMAGGPPLDLVYSGKAGATLFELAAREPGPTLFWASKSSAPLARASADQIARAPYLMRAWLRNRHRARPRSAH